MKLYRGFNNNYPNLGVKSEQKGIWLTDDFDYAKNYADMFKNGAVAEVELDDNANIANEYECMSVFEDDEDWQDMAEYICDLGGDTVMDNQVCNKLADCGYDGVMFDDSGVDCYYVFNRKMINGSKIIKTLKNNREDAMESLCEGVGNKEIVVAYRGLELPPNSDKLKWYEYAEFFKKYNGEYYFEEGTPQWFSCYSCISTTYGSWVVKAKLQLNNMCDLTDNKVLHTVLPNFFNKMKKEILPQYYKGEELKRQLSIIDKCGFNSIKDDIYLNWKDIIDEIKKQGYDSIKSLEDSEDLMYIDNGYIIWSMNNIVDYVVRYYDCRSEKYYTPEQYKEGIDTNGTFWYERLNSDDYDEDDVDMYESKQYKPLTESLCEGLANKPISFTAYHGGVEPDMTPDEGRAFYLTDDYDLAHLFARREVYDDGLYEGEIPTVFTFKGTFNNPYYLTDDEYDSEGQDSNIDYEKWVEMGVDGLVYEGQGGSTYYIVIDLSTIKLVDKKVYWEEEIKDDDDIEESVNNYMLSVLLESNILTEDIAAVKKYFPKVPEEKIQTLIELDPTYQGGDNLGKFGKWILGLYNKGQLKDEDFYKVPQYLTTFKDNLKKIQNKDIMSYKTLPDLAQAIQDYEGQKDVSKKQQVKQLKSDEAEKVLETPNWLIIHPKTHKADCYYGANTKWCTASKDNDSWFEEYNAKGPLFILINKKNGKKYQFHFETLSFMNELDKPVSPMRLPVMIILFGSGV